MGGAPGMSMWYDSAGRYPIVAPLKEMLNEKWRTVSSGVSLTVWDIITEFKDTKYSFLTPAIDLGWSGKNKNNCQSTHYRIVQKCLGKGRLKSRDIKRHMIFKACRAIAKRAGHKTYKDYADEVKTNLRDKIESKHRRRLLMKLSGYRIIDRLLRETQRASECKA